MMLGRLFTILLTVMGLLVLGTTQTNAQRYSGQATAIKATVGIPGINPLTTAINDTGELPSGGGTITLASASTSIANAALTAGTSNSTTSGGTPAGTSHSMTSVQNLNFSVLGNTITAASVSTVTDCACPTQTCTGRTVIVGLTLNGAAVNITGDANQTILLTGPLGNTVGTLILDEQLFGSGSKTVNGLHLRVADSTTGLATDVVISSSHSDIICITDTSDNFFSGRAYGLGSIITTDTLLAGRSTVATLVDDTGPLPDTGGFIGPVVVAGSTLPGLLSTGTLVSSTSGGITGGNRVADSSSNVQTLNATVAGFGITATVLTSQTHCQCGLGTASTCTGGSVITNLLITTPIGATITGTINSNPNNVITLNVAGIAVATIITNQQIPPSPTSTGSITVNALHIITGTSIPGVSTSTTDTIIASSHSDIVCGSVVPTAAGVTVSGRVLSPDNRGLRNVLVTLTSPTGVRFSTTTSAFGNFRLEGIPAGQTYVAQVQSKLYRFASQLIPVEDELTGLTFVAQD